MLNKAFHFILGFLIWGPVAHAQNVVVRAESGFGTFYMSDLKVFQSSLLPDLGVDVKTLSRFPGYYGYGVSLLYVFKSGTGVGFCSDIYSTGGRNYHKDYSGLYKLDILTHAYNVGTVLSKKLYEGKRLVSNIEIQQGLKFSKLTMNETMVVTEPVFDHTINLVSSSWWIKPGFRAEYKVFKFLSVGTFAGGEINLNGILHLKGNKDAVLQNQARQKVTINWSGLRVALSLSGNITILQREE
jgi:hypothetical protein